MRALQNLESPFFVEGVDTGRQRLYRARRHVYEQSVSAPTKADLKKGHFEGLKDDWCCEVTLVKRGA